jgi:hypothetical protein
MKTSWPLIILCFIIYSCTTVGVANKAVLDKFDFGPPEKLRICIYKDAAVSDRQTQEIIAALQKEFVQFGLEIEVPLIKNWKRPAFNGSDILKNFATCPLESPCDRLLALVGRDFKDFLWGTIMPEIHGAVEDLTMTKGFAVAEVGSFNQVISFSSAASISIHETYHLLGCGHGLGVEPCYAQIARVKKIARNSRLAGGDFFPSLTADQSVLITRLGVEKKLKPFQNNTLECETISSKKQIVIQDARIGTPSDFREAKPFSPQIFTD